MTDEEKWEMVKSFYQSCYFDPVDRRKKFQFKSKPADAAIELLFKEMMKFRKSIGYYYDEQQFLTRRLERARSNPALYEKREEYD